MKFAADRPYGNPEIAARKLIEIANAVEAVQDGRIYIELINAPFLYELKGCAYRKSSPSILMMQSAQDWATKNVPDAVDGARDRCIFLQGEMRASPIAIFHVTEQQVTEVALAEYNNVVKAYPSD
jgi:hypothetical protein